MYIINVESDITIQITKKRQGYKEDIVSQLYKLFRLQFIAVDHSTAIVFFFVSLNEAVVIHWSDVAAVAPAQLLLGPGHLSLVCSWLVSERM